MVFYADLTQWWLRRTQTKVELDRHWPGRRSEDGAIMRIGFANQMTMRATISSLSFTHELVELHLAAVGETRAPCSAMQFGRGWGGGRAMAAMRGALLGRSSRNRSTKPFHHHRLDVWRPCAMNLVLGLVRRSMPV